MVPLYEYQCNQCSKRFEVRQAMGEDGSKLNCPGCNAGNPQRIISTFSSPGASGSLGLGDNCSTFSGST